MVFHHLVVVLTQVYLVDLLLLDLVLQLLQQLVAEAADQKMVTLHPVAALVLVDLTVHLAVVEKTDKTEVQETHLLHLLHKEVMAVMVTQATKAVAVAAALEELVVFQDRLVVLTQVYLVDLLLLDLVLQLLQQLAAEAADQKMVTLHPVAALLWGS